MKFEYDKDNDQWTVWDKAGYQYIFATKEYTTTLQTPPGSDNNNSESAASLNLTRDPAEPLIVSAWYLDKIISTTGEEVAFQYKTSENGVPYVSQGTIAVSESWSNIIGNSILVPASAEANRQALQAVEASTLGMNPALDLMQPLSATPVSIANNTPGGNPFCKNEKKYYASQPITYHVYPEKISFRNGNVSFQMSGRSDMGAYTDFQGVTYSSPQKLDKVVISGADGVKKQYTLQQSYFDEGAPANCDKACQLLNYRLRLDAVTESNQSVSKPPHRFTYHTGELPPKNSKDRDHWGYYNYNGESNETLIPTVVYIDENNSFRTIDGANREMNEATAKIGGLIRMDYPTGGYTTFAYEAHTFNRGELPLVPEIETRYGFDGDIITVDYQTDINVISTLQCNTVSPFPGGSNEPCDFGSELWPISFASITEVETGNVKHNVTYGLYECRFPENASLSSCQTITPTENMGGIVDDRIIREVKPGTYKLSTNPLGDFSTNISVRFEQPKEENRIVKGGGLRIQKVEDYDAVSGSVAKVRTYAYTTTKDGELRSTGKLMSVPLYTYLEGYSGSNPNTSCTLAKSASYSNQPLGSSAQGSFVGYNQVTERRGANGEYGKSIYYYMNEPDEAVEGIFLPNAPSRTHEASNGLLKAVEHYNAANVKVQEVRNAYDYQQELTPAVMLVSINCSGSIVHVKNFDLASEWWYMTSSTDKQYDTDTRQAITTTTAYQYNPKHLQVIRTETKNSEKQPLVKAYRYAADFPDGTTTYGSNLLRDKHMHSQVLEQTMTVAPSANQSGSGTPTQKITTQYEQVASHVVPKIITHYPTGDTEARQTEYEYDSYGNITQVLGPDGVPTSYIWGYNHTLPVAQVVGASVAALASKAATEKIQTLDREALLAELNKLRSLPDVQVTTYTHDPLIGITSVTDPDNRTSTYHYDDLNRLQWIESEEGHVVQKFDYQYAQ